VRSKVVIYFDGKVYSFIEGYHPFHPKKVESKSPKGFEEVAPIYVVKSLFKIEKKKQ
jgi:ribosomal protein L32E